MLEITEYIEMFYNRQRKQARLGFRSPAAYVQAFHEAWAHYNVDQVNTFPCPTCNQLGDNLRQSVRRRPMAEGFDQFGVHY